MIRFLDRIVEGRLRCRTVRMKKESNCDFLAVGSSLGVGNHRRLIIAPCVVDIFIYRLLPCFSFGYVTSYHWILLLNFEDPILGFAKMRSVIDGKLRKARLS
jgi:hypothetical protein